MSSPPTRTAAGSVGPIPAAAQELIDQVKSDHAKEVAVLTKDFNEKCRALSSDNCDLLQENDELRSRLEGMQETIDKKEKLLYLLIGGGAPAPQDPCNLCGRVGNLYAEDKGERTTRREPWVPRPWDDRKNDGPQDNTTPQVDITPQIIGNNQNGKHLLESNGGYMIESIHGQDWRRFQIQMRGAWQRKMEGTDKESHRQLLNKPFPTEEEFTTAEGRRNIMTGWLKPLGAGSYDEWFTKHRTGRVDFPDQPGYDTQDPIDQASEAKQDRDVDDSKQYIHSSDLFSSTTTSSKHNTTGEVDSNGWTEEELEFANRPVTGSDPWSKISPAWHGETAFGDKTGDDSGNESESESESESGDGEESAEHKDDGSQCAEGTDDADQSDEGSHDSDETVKAAA